MSRMASRALRGRVGDICRESWWERRTSDLDWILMVLACCPYIDLRDFSRVRHPSLCLAQFSRLLVVVRTKRGGNEQGRLASVMVARRGSSGGWMDGWIMAPEKRLPLHWRRLWPHACLNATTALFPSSATYYESPSILVSALLNALRMGETGEEVLNISPAPPWCSESLTCRNFWKLLSDPDCTFRFSLGTGTRAIHEPLREHRAQRHGKEVQFQPHKLRQRGHYSTTWRTRTKYVSPVSEVLLVKDFSRDRRLGGGRIRSNWYENRDRYKDAAQPLPPGWIRQSIKGDEAAWPLLRTGSIIYTRGATNTSIDTIRFSHHGFLLGCGIALSPSWTCRSRCFLPFRSRRSIFSAIQ